MIRPLFKQSIYSFIGLVAGKILGTILVILLARQLLPTGFGAYTFFLTLVQVITYIADVGLIQWYQKKAANDTFKTVLLNKILTVRIITLCISLLMAFTFLFITQSFNTFITVVLLVTLLPEALLSVFDGFYLEKRQTLRVALKTFSKSMVFLVGYIFLYDILTVQIATLLYLVSSLMTALWYIPWPQLQHSHLVPFKQAIATLKSSTAYALLIVTSFAYSRGDALAIRYLLNNAALGLYGAAYRYLEVFALLPTALATNLFSLSAKKEGVPIVSLVKLTFLIGSIGFFASMFLYVTSEFLTIQLLGEAYRPVQPILQIFSLVVFLFFINAPISTVVQSSHFVKAFLPFGIANTVLNIILNIICIPYFGIQASAWIMAFTEFTGLLINCYFVKKIYT